MRRGFFALMMLAAALILGGASGALAQDKYEIKQTKFFIYDKSGHAWNDPSAFLGVRLDSSKKDSLEDQELTAGTISYSTGGDYQRYAVKFDASGNCYAEVPFVVYKASDKAIYYEITLIRKDGDKFIPVALTSRTISVTRSSPERFPVNASIFRPMLVNDWLLYGAIMVVSILFVYFVFFRWLFSILLFNHNWPVSRAEYFTTSISLMMVLAVFGLLLVLFLPQTVVMYTILSLLTLFWVGHAITWAIS
jgi:hypothetical protein